MDVLAFLNTHFLPERKGIHISSLQFNIKDGDGTFPIDQCKAIHSWEMPDYEEACCSGFKTKEELKSLLVEDSDEDSEDACMESDGALIIMDERLSTLLARKLYYAGGSARFMFDHTMEDLVNNVLSTLLGRMPPKLWEDFAMFSMYDSSDETVSSLMQVIGGKKTSNGRCTESAACPVSKYMLLKAYKHCEGGVFGFD